MANRISVSDFAQNIRDKKKTQAEDPEKLTAPQQVLLGAVPTLIGLALGGTEGGAIGAKAGQVALSQAQAEEKERRKLREKQLERATELERQRRKEDVQQKQLQTRQQQLGIQLSEAQRRGRGEERQKRKLVIDEVNKDKTVQKGFEALSNARDAQVLVAEIKKTGNPIAFNTLKRKLARLSGEVGVLTVQDVQQFSGSQAFDVRMKQAAETLVTGGPTPENLKLIEDLLTQLGDGTKSRLRKRIADRAATGGRIAGIGKQEAVQLFDTESFLEDPPDLFGSRQADTQIAGPGAGGGAFPPEAQAAPRQFTSEQLRQEAERRGLFRRGL